jgi:hypothetical protein
VAALAILDAQKPPYTEDIVIALVGLGEAQLGLGAPEKALPPLERATALVKNVPRSITARAQFALARALFAAGRDVARARTLATTAAKTLASLGPVAAADGARIREWLAERTSNQQ